MMPNRRRNCPTDLALWSEYGKTHQLFAMIGVIASSISWVGGHPSSICSIHIVAGWRMIQRFRSSSALLSGAVVRTVQMDNPTETIPEWLRRFKLTCRLNLARAGANSGPRCWFSAEELQALVNRELDLPERSLTPSVVWTTESPEVFGHQDVLATALINLIRNG